MIAHEPTTDAEIRLIAELRAAVGVTFPGLTWHDMPDGEMSLARAEAMEARQWMGHYEALNIGLRRLVVFVVENPVFFPGSHEATALRWLMEHPAKAHKKGGPV